MVCIPVSVLAYFSCLPLPKNDQYVQLHVRICNSAQGFFCETRLHRYKRIHDLETASSNRENLVEVGQSLGLRVCVTTSDPWLIQKSHKDASFYHADSLQYGTANGVLEAIVVIPTTSCIERCHPYDWDVSELFLRVRIFSA